MSQTTPITRSGLLISIASAIVFGFYPIAAQQAYLDGANAPFVVLVTTSLRAIVLMPFCIGTGREVMPKAGRLRATILGGACQFGSIWGIMSSVRLVPAPVTIVIVFLHTTLLLVFFAYRRELPWSVSLIATTVGALLGVSLVVDVWGHLNGLNVIGIALALFAALMTAIRLYLFGKEVQDLHPIVAGAQVFFVAGMCAAAWSLTQGITPPQTSSGLWWTAGSGLALILGTFGMFYGIALLGSFTWSLLAKVEPIFTAFFAYVLLDQALLTQQYVGMALLLGSLIAYQLASQGLGRKS